MKRLYLSALALALPAFTIGNAGPSKSGSIQGGWQVVEVTIPGPTGRTITNVQPNLTIVTPKHYSRVEVHADAPRPILLDAGKATADELRATWGPLVAEAGTYEVTGGNVIIMRPIVSKNPAAMSAGAYSSFVFKLAGDTLWITPQSTEKGPVPSPAKIKAIRVE